MTDVPGQTGTGLVVWLTGLPGSGKTTLAEAVRMRLRAEKRAVCLLDGDRLRTGLSPDLGYDREARREAVRRAAEIALLLADQEIVVLVALVSPYALDRDAARQRIGTERFREVFVDAPLAICQARDPKGHYRRARGGHLVSFTGVDDPYEAPLSPELRLPTAEWPLATCVQRLLDVIGLPMSPPPCPSEEVPP